MGVAQWAPQRYMQGPRDTPTANDRWAASAFRVEAMWGRDAAPNRIRSARAAAPPLCRPLSDRSAVAPPPLGPQTTVRSHSKPLGPQCALSPLGPRKCALGPHWAACPLSDPASALSPMGGLSPLGPCKCAFSQASRTAARTVPSRTPQVRSRTALCGHLPPLGNTKVPCTVLMPALPPLFLSLCSTLAVTSLSDRRGGHLSPLTDSVHSPPSRTAVRSQTAARSPSAQPPSAR